MVSRQKVTLTLSEKIGLIKKTRPGISQCNLAAEYGISQSQVSCVIKDRTKFLETSTLVVIHQENVKEKENMQMYRTIVKYHNIILNLIDYRYFNNYTYYIILIEY